MKQTTNAVLKITMDSVNGKECHEDTGVAVLRREDETETSNDNKEKNLPQEILDIPDGCEENAVKEDFAEKNVAEILHTGPSSGDNSQEKKIHNESTSPTQSETAELCAPPTTVP